MSDSGRLCKAPRTSVLFDGIPTLTGLDGDIWARQLLTLNLSTSSASIKFNFTTATDNIGLTHYAGLETIEVVMFNCPSRGIGTNNIAVSGDGALIGTLIVPQSCNYLVRACIDNQFSTTSLIVTLTFNNMLQRIYIAEVIFYASENHQCSPVGPINGSVLNISVSATGKFY